MGVERFTTATGDVFAVPHSLKSYVWWFRQDLLQQAGLTSAAGHWD